MLTRHLQFLSLYFTSESHNESTVMSFKVQPKGLSTKGKELIYFQQLNKSWAIQNDQKINSTMI